jgi:probable O-glycosylation ligase (exosortase A-associated)
MFWVFMAMLGSEYAGLAHHFIPALKAAPFVTLLSLGLFAFVMATGGAANLFRHPQAWLWLIFIALSALAMLHGVISRNALTVMKAQIANFTWMAILVYFLKDWARIRAYILFMMVVHVFVIIVNLDLILSSNRTIYFRASYFFGDGNDFAWGLNVMMPMVLFLAMNAREKWVKVVAMVGVGVLVMAIIGTQSRGATLALGAGLLYFFLFITRKRMRMAIAGILLGLALLPFVPDTYFGRMSTLASYEEDTSATGRIQAWTRALEMAADNPVLGVGAGSFNSAYGRYYRQAGDPARWISTHSIYFKVVAEYGFPGVTVLLLLLYFGYRMNVRTVAALRATPEEKRPLDVAFPLYLNQSLVAYSVSGIFLGGIDYPHLYLLTALFVATHELGRRGLERSRTPDEATVSSPRPREVRRVR